MENIYWNSYVSKGKGTTLNILVTILNNNFQHALVFLYNDKLINYTKTSKDDTEITCIIFCLLHLLFLHALTNLCNKKTGEIVK